MVQKHMNTAVLDRTCGTTCLTCWIHHIQS